MTSTDSSVAERARAALAEGDAAYRSAEPDLPAAEKAYKTAIQLLRKGEATPRHVHLLGSAWLNLGNLYSHGDQGAQLEAALSCYARASHLLDPLAARGEPAWIADAAAAWANRGQILLRASQRDSLEIAKESFACAIAGLRRLFPTNEPRFLHNLAGMLLNLGQVQRASRQPGAIDSLVEAGDIAERLPEDHRQGRRLRARVQINLGNAIWDESRDSSRAVAAFDRGLEALGAIRSDASRADWTLAATLWADRSHVLAEDAAECRADEVKLAAGRALDLCASSASVDPLAAELTLLARRSLAVVEGRRLTALERDGHDAEATALELSDLIDESLEIARRWAGRHPERFQPFVHRFFRLGLEVYGRACPAFLGEFIAEQFWERKSDALPALEDPLLLKWSRESVTGSLHRLRYEEPIRIGTPAAEHLIEIVERLKGVTERLERTSVATKDAGREAKWPRTPAARSS